MSEVATVILSLSLSGSVLMLVLLIGKLFLKHKLSKMFSYYIWLLVLLRLVLPVTGPVNLINLFLPINQASVSRSVSESIVTQMEIERGGYPQLQMAEENTATKPQTTQSVGFSGENTVVESQRTFQPWLFVKNNFVGFWLIGAVISLGWFMIAYAVFTRPILRSCTVPHHNDLAIFAQLCCNGRVRLVCSKQASTPMLLGVLRPTIVLPQYAYATNGMSNDLRNILRHELTHYRRRDVLYKWLAVIVTSVHWFNPFMIFLRREISRACELSCDEAVIRGMSPDEKQAYGNTLLTLASNKKIPSGILATTLSEDKKELRERLISIMKFKKRPLWMIIPPLILAVIFAGCATTLGVVKSSESSTLTDGTAYSRKMDGTKFDWRDTGCSYSMDENGSVMLSYDGGTANAKAPLHLSSNTDGNSPSTDNTGFFLSDEKTAIAYWKADPFHSIAVLTSADKGQSWENAEIAFANPVSWIKIGFTTKEHGWLVTCSPPAMGAENHAIYTTSDGGKTWTAVQSNIDTVYGRMLSGAGFINDKIGFLCFRYETDFQPAVCMTQDGGLTWSKLEIHLPEEYEQYHQTPLSPIFDGKRILLPVLLTGDNGEVGTVYLERDSQGDAWNFIEASSSSGKLLGSSPTGIKFYKSSPASDKPDMVFINSSTGWRAIYDLGDTHQENITLWKTSDGGENWDKITSTADKNFTIPLAAKTGFTFLDSSNGWITTMTPQEGYIGLFRTSDGGDTWVAQEIRVPTDYIKCQFLTYPPTFFSDNDGVLLNYVFSNSSKNLEPLVYITHDKGENWILSSQNIVNQNLKWTYSPGTNTNILWSVTYQNQLWTSNDGITWAVPN